MKRTLMLLGLFLVAVAIVPMQAARPGFADDDDDDNDNLLYDRAEIFIEFNDTDQDVGIQVLLDGEPWKKVRAFDPDGHKILDIRTKRSLQDQGLSELFFESSEPSLDEVTLEEFLERFQEGIYEFEGRTIENDDIEAEATLTHVIPAGPEVLTPVAMGDELPVVDPDHVVIAWNPVMTTIFGSPEIEVIRYQVIVTQEEPKRVFSIDVPATTTAVTVPSEFFAQPDTVHNFEILAVEVSGNQTISGGEFLTQP